MESELQRVDSLDMPLAVRPSSLLAPGVYLTPIVPEIKGALQSWRYESGPSFLSTKVKT